MDRKLTLLICAAILVALSSLSGAQASTTLQGTGTAYQLSTEPIGRSLLATNSGPNNPQARIGSDFSYQGRLLSGGTPANGQFDFQFSLWDAATGGNNVAGTLNVLTVTVTSGLFTTQLDFGADAFQGQGRWMQIAVRPAGGPLYTILAPRQQLSPAPYALTLRAGATITGTLTSPILSAINEGGNAGLYGSSVDGSGVFGESTTGNGVRGASESEDGVQGHSNTQYGVHGTSDGGYGGYFSSGGNYGIYSESTDIGGRGVLGKADNGSNSIGVYGTSRDGYGLYGYSANKIGVYGLSNATDGSGVYGSSSESDGVGVYGYNNAEESTAIYGNSPSGVGGLGVYGSAFTNITNGVGVYGEGGFSGVWGYAESIAQGASAIIGEAPFQSATLAGSFLGDVEVTGDCCAAGAGSFRIDHPLDPENKFLYQSLVSSPDMVSIYNGNVTTDANGNAIVTLPDYVEALNRDFRYQLTVIGQFAQAIVSSTVKDNRFSIKTDKPNVEVSWQVTGIRQDPYANNNRIPVEQEKPAEEKGLFLYPADYGQPEGKGIRSLLHQQRERMHKPVPDPSNDAPKP